MRIIAPLSHADEARVLPGLGADELYFSIQPAGAGVALNRRELPRANFTRIEDAARAADLVHHRGARVFVALNKVFYTDAELPRVARILDQCLDAGVDGAIVAEPRRSPGARVSEPDFRGADLQLVLYQPGRSVPVSARFAGRVQGPPTDRQRVLPELYRERGGRGRCARSRAGSVS